MSHAPQTNREMSPATRRGIIAWIAWGTAGLAGFAALIFLAADRMD